jgi:superfamily II DNA/RNA helicase
MGFENATPLQAQTIPLILQGNDLIACAQTGTGKTAAYTLPILQKIYELQQTETSTLIIVPTRELAIQIDKEIQGFSYFLSINSFPVYGGGDGLDWEYQKRALSTGGQIIIATPGKLISHLDLGFVKFENIKYLILDEADRMLDMGFYDDIKRITSYLPKHIQTLMFSATMPPKIRILAKELLKNPEEINIALSKPAEGVLQAAYLVHENQKSKLINLLIADKPEFDSILIFSSTKRKIQDIVKSLSSKTQVVAGISSDLEQSEREEVLQQFRSKKIRILVATDVLSRGIDIKDINLIINYDVPNDAEDYVHRIGRTARADATGVALTLVSEDEMYKLHQIEKLIEKQIYKLNVPAELGTSPEWKIKSFNRKKGSRKFFKKKK